MTKQFSCYLCNGLSEQIFGNQVAQLIAWLNANTPDGIHFNEVGGFDPRPPVQDQITAAVEADIAAGKTVIFGGHSLGAGLCYYLADALNAKSQTSPLFFAIDPTQWGTNIPPAASWALMPPTPGQWVAPPNIGIFINFHQPVYPGGGVCVRGGDDIAVPNTDHIGIPNTDLVRGTVVNAINRVLAEP
jgi:hypothetical protein